MSADCHVAAKASIPRSVFRTTTLPATERFAVWRESVLPLFEALPDNVVSPENFRARVDGYDLHQLLFSQTSFSAQWYRRRPGYKADGNVDPLLVQLYLDGGFEGRNGHKEIQVRPGDISLLDLSQSLSTHAKDSNTLSLVIPREQLAAYAGSNQFQCATVLRAGTPLAEILGQHLRTVWRNLSFASVAEIETINQMLLGTIAGVFADNKRRHDASWAALEHATLETVLAHINHHLADRLGPEQLCRRFGCSRTQLYRLFQPLGGVAAYIRQARLNRCLEEITWNGGTRERIIDIAMRWGFSSHSHFCHLFREAFDLTPSEALERAMAGYPLIRDKMTNNTDPMPTYHHWLRRL